MEVTPFYTPFTLLFQIVGLKKGNYTLRVKLLLMSSLRLAVNRNLMACHSNHFLNTRTSTLLYPMGFTLAIGVLQDCQTQAVVFENIFCFLFS